MNGGLLVGKYLANISDGIVIKITNHKGQTVEVPVKLLDNILDRVHEYCKLDDVIGIKYYLEPDKEQGVVFVADKVTFLSRKEADPASKGGDEDGNI